MPDHTQHDTFKRDVARALGMDVHEKLDEAVILSKIRRTPGNAHRSLLTCAD
jgi:hypothetical protein